MRRKDGASNRFGYFISFFVKAIDWRTFFLRFFFFLSLVSQMFVYLFVLHKYRLTKLPHVVSSTRIEWTFTWFNTFFLKVEAAVASTNESLYADQGLRSDDDTEQINLFCWASLQSRLTQLLFEVAKIWNKTGINFNSRWLSTMWFIEGDLRSNEEKKSAADNNANEEENKKIYSIRMSTINCVYNVLVCIARCCLPAISGSFSGHVITALVIQFVTMRMSERRETAKWN